MSCIWVVFDKQMVLRTKRFMRVRHVKCFRSIFCGRCFRGVGRLCSSGVRESAHPSTRSSDVMIRPVLPGPHCPGTQRYRCQATAGQGRTVLLAYTDAGHAAGVKQPSLAMAMHVSGMRATARVLHGSPTPVITALQKKEPAVQPVHHAVLTVLHPKQVEVEIWRSDELAVRRGLSSALDEMWSFVQAKAGLDHGAGHSLLLLCDAKASRGKNSMKFKGLGDDLFNVFISLF